MAASFYGVFLLSPWITAFARNAYWVEFTWFLPVLAGLICSVYRDAKIQIFCIFCIFISILTKCLCGYEYISAIMMATVAFLFFDMCDVMIKKDKAEVVRSLKLLLWASAACIAGFVAALCIHAYLRGDGRQLLLGIHNVVLCRYGTSMDQLQKYRKRIQCPCWWRFG